MPWRISRNDPRCPTWAVIQTDADTIAGCHDTREQAEAQMAALYAAEADQYR